VDASRGRADRLHRRLEKRPQRLKTPTKTEVCPSQRSAQGLSPEQNGGLSLWGYLGGSGFPQVNPPRNSAFARSVPLKNQVCCQKGRCQKGPPKKGMPEVCPQTRTKPPKNEVCPRSVPSKPKDGGLSPENGGVSLGGPGLFPRECAFAWSVPSLSSVAESPARDRPSVSESFAQNIAHGILRGRYRNSLLKPELMEVGVVYEIRVDLGPVAAKLGAGQKLRVEMSGADFPAL
jgi:hypothetical protein